MLQYIQYLKFLVDRRQEERGASAVEYGLLVAAIAAVIVATVFLLGGLIDTAFDTTCDEVNRTADCA